MKGWYFVGPNRNEILDIPYVLLDIYENTLYNPDVLEERVLAWKNGYIDLSNWRNGGWEIIEVSFPDNYIKNFIKECSKGNKKGIKKVVSELYRLGRIKKKWKKKEEDYYDQEDYEDKWWKRGEKAPWE